MALARTDMETLSLCFKGLGIPFKETGRIIGRITGWISVRNLEGTWEDTLSHILKTYTE